MNRLLRNNSRTTNTIFNLSSSILGQLITIVMQFAVRTVFINTLGKSYLGINGLFSNILTMLSLAELGVGSAILFKLYEPIAKNDKHRIAILMKFYKTVYRVIGIAIIIIGVCLIPFLPFIISDYDSLATLNIRASLIFILYLFKSASTYFFFAYKTAIIKANQKEYLLNLISYLFTIGMSVIQIVCLLISPNFEVYVLISVGEIVVRNFVNAKLADVMYPYINEKTTDKISVGEIKEIFKDCIALLIQKINGVVLKASDNIVMSMFLGLESVALYSNYYVLYTTLTSLFSRVFDSVVYSLGNLHTTNDKDHEYEIFKSVNLITVILGGTAGVGIAVCADELIHVWIGNKWIISQPFSLLMGMETFTLALRLSLSKYRSTMGLFQQMKYRPIASMMINLVISVVLVQSCGISGVLVGTIIADWTTAMWFDPVIIYKYGFREKYQIRSYFLRILKYVIVTTTVGIIDYWICVNLFVNHGWISVFIHMLICGISVPVALVISVRNQTEGKYVFKLGMNYIRKIMHKKRS